MRNQQSVHKRAKDARWRSHKAVMQGCIKTATQSRCTMQGHKWLSLHRCNGTNGCRCTDVATQTADEARMRNQQSKHDVQGCTIAVAQSRRKDAPTQTTANARMRDSACPKFRTMRNQQSKHDSTTPLHFRPLNKRGIFFWCWGANSHCAGKARMPYKMNAQSFKHGCLKSAALSLYARMHKDSHTKPLCKDA